MRVYLLVAGSAALIAVGAACTHSYDEFEFRDSTSGGSGGSAQDGSSGKAGGGATSDASAGSGGSAAGDGSAAGGSGGGKGDGGPAGSGSGGSAGSSNCPQYQIECGGACVSGTDRARCGGCTNDCEQQGNGLQCIDMRCGCQNAGQCGMGPTSHCALTVGRCVCGGTQCRAGEVCNSGACSCNGAAACAQNQICCLSGCATRC